MPVWEVGYNPYRIYPTTFTTDSDGNTYLIGSNGSSSSVVNKYDASNRFLGQTSLPGCPDTGDPIYQVIYNATLRQYYTVQSGGGRNICIQTYDADFKSKRTTGGRDTGLMAVDNAGNMYLSSTATSLITKISPDGTVLARIGTPGNKDGEFERIVSVSVDSQNNLYVVDFPIGLPEGQLRYRIQKLDATGKILLKWALNVESSTVVANRLQTFVDKSDRLVILSNYETKTARTSTFYQYSPSGQLLQTSKSEPLNFIQIAPDGADGFRALSVQEAAVYNYNARLEVSGVWRYADNPGQFADINSVAVNGQGEVFVADGYNKRIQKFDANGRYVRSFEGNRNMQMATDRQGNLFVSESGFSESGLVPSTQHVRKLDASGKFVTVFGGFGREPGQFSLISALATDPDGNVYVGDYDNQRISKFDNNGKFLQQWVLRGRPMGLAVDNQSNVYVYEQETREIARYDANGKPLGRWKRGGINRTTTEDFTDRLILSTDAQNNLYVAYTYSPIFERYTSDGALTGSWRVPPTPVSPPVSVPGMAVAPDGTLVVATQLNLDGRVIKYRLS
jgi:tripartite motif-containing protein 71